jgi:cell division septal protein FtsQ
MTFLKGHVFAFCPSVKRLGYLKGVTKTWNLPVENDITLLLSAILWHLRMRKYFKCYKQSDFIMQNYYVKKYETIFTVQTEITRKN